MQELREIRDKIASNSKIHDVSVWKTKYNKKSATSVVADSRAKYGKK